MNPFLTIGYGGQEYFCDREEETKALISAITNNRAVNLTSIRRIGKTALIKHVFHQLPKTYVPVFIDLEGTDNLNAFISRFTNELAKKLSQIDKGMIGKLLSWASTLGASVSLDPLDGSPKLEFSRRSNAKIDSLDGLLHLMDNHDKRIFVLAIDEFQELSKYENNNTEGWIRAKMQEFPNVRFIFSGSEQSLMQRIFDDPKRPFYQITQPMHLSYIPDDQYLKFITHHLKKYDQVSEKDIQSVLDWCRGYTYYVQYFCNILYGKLDAGNYSSLEEIKWEILESNKHFFLSQQKLVTSLHWKLLKAIAKEGEVINYTSRAFVQKTEMATTSIKRSIESLLEKALLLNENSAIRIYNVFFQRYLETLL
ncbi:MAG: ATP-binding protein [Ekhidna sp.]|uniref:AAA family ATPase n=1 Tax=Ekhidna sp. TaxID=2608089 RepID=UPI0032EF4560